MRIWCWPRNLARAFSSAALFVMLTPGLSSIFRQPLERVGSRWCGWPTCAGGACTNHPHTPPPPAPLLRFLRLRLHCRLRRPPSAAFPAARELPAACDAATPRSTSPAGSVTNTGHRSNVATGPSAFASTVLLWWPDDLPFPTSASRTTPGHAMTSVA